MKANDILNKIKNIVGVELSEEKVELAEISLKNGTLLVSEEFTKGNAVFIKSEDGEMALPIGEYELEDGRTLFVVEEGLIDSISEAAAEEAEEELSEETVTEETVETELEEEEEKEEMKYVTKEELSAEVAEPIKHNPEAETKNVHFTIAGKRTETTKDRVYNKIFNNN